MIILDLKFIQKNDKVSNLWGFINKFSNFVIIIDYSQKVLYKISKWIKKIKTCQTIKINRMI